MTIDRRAFLQAAAAVGAAAWLPARAAEPRTFALEAKAGSAPLVGDPHPATGVWAYNGTVPGPELRVRQGERVRVAVTNRLAEGTTVHWHGVRVPNAMDGVPGLTQAPIGPNGGTFAYEFLSLIHI